MNFMNDKHSYAVEAACYRIARFAAHNFWVLRGPDHNVIAELHGLSTNRKTGQIMPIGKIEDRLGFYEFIAGSNHVPAEGTRLLRASRDFKIMYSGGKEDVLGRWRGAVDQLESLNKRDIDYSPFGIFAATVVNSNTAYCLFAKLMNIDHYCFPGVWEPGINSIIT